MAAASSWLKSSIVVVQFSIALFLLFSSMLPTTHSLKHETLCSFDSVFTFGQGKTSISDGGLVMMPQHHHHHPLTSAFGLAWPSHFSDQLANFQGGASFASPRSTVLTLGFLDSHGSHQPPKIFLPSSLHSQVVQFEDFLGSRLMMLYGERQNNLRHTLFFINHPGLQDYKLWFQGRSIEQVWKVVPEIVMEIKNNIRQLIYAGASNVLVSGVSPLVSQHAELEQGSSSASREDLSTLSKLHFDHLFQAVIELRSEFPEANVMIVDYYKVTKEALRDSAIGFAKARACSLP